MGTGIVGLRHTKAPWKADRNLGCKRVSAKLYSNQKQARRTELFCTSGLNDEKEDLANALIAAASPVMYQALIAILRETLNPTCPAGEYQEVLRDICRAALKGLGVKL